MSSNPLLRNPRGEQTEPERVFAIVCAESNEYFWNRINEFMAYFVIIPLTMGGAEPNCINDYKWLTGDFIDEYVKRSLIHPNPLDKLYYIIKIYTRCSYINVNHDKSEFKRLIPLFNLNIKLSLQKTLEIVSEDFPIVTVDNIELLLPWVEKNEYLYSIMEPLYIFWNMFNDNFEDDVTKEPLNQMKIILQNYDKISY